MTETFLLINLMIDFLNRKWDFKNPATFKNALKDVTAVSENWDVSNLATKLILYNIHNDKLLSPKRILSLVNEVELSLEARMDILRQVLDIIQIHSFEWLILRKVLILYRSDIPQASVCLLSK